MRIGNAVAIVTVDLGAPAIRVRLNGTSELLRLSLRSVPNAGRRYSVHCPECDAAREVLYLEEVTASAYLRCRVCLGLVYEGDYVSVEEHAAFLLQRLRVALGGPAYRRLDVPFPEKPARMSEASYQKRVAKAIELLERMVPGSVATKKSRTRNTTRLERARRMAEQSEKRVARLLSRPLRKADLIVGPDYRDPITATIGSRERT